MSTSLRAKINTDTQSSVTTWKDSMLTSAFDEQIKLVERSLASFEGDAGNAHKKKTVKKLASNKPEESGVIREHGIFSNRSKLYRFEATNEAETKPPKTSQTQIHPPPESRPDSPDDQDSETEPRAKMLMSWYMAGYHTGYYDAMRKNKQNLK